MEERINLIGIDNARSTRKRKDPKELPCSWFLVTMVDMDDGKTITIPVREVNAARAQNQAKTIYFEGLDLDEDEAADIEEDINIETIFNCGHLKPVDVTGNF